MSSTYVRSLRAEHARSRRAFVISLLGPVTIAAGAVWAIVQPYRLTLLHPLHQGFWWLVIEPQLLVALAGVFFALVVARPLLADLAEREE
ncbi:MAG TPA: hypothetical protein VGU02_16585 [Gaiellaceae bacterium]|nr:hypothetical protein [Gaiellaceae bacterium]